MTDKTSNENAPLVLIEGMTKSFHHDGNELKVLRGVELRIERGEMLCVVGASGAGKSTLLHILGTLDLPTSGKIEYLGTDVTELAPAKLAKFRNESIGFVFQFHHLLPEFSAVENVMMPGLIRGLSRGDMAPKAEKLLTEVGLKERLHHRPGELSGGEQQRVALARALIMDPMLVLADEPTGNLDTETSDAMHRLFFRLNRDRNITFLIVTHSRDLADRMPRVVTMRDGQIESELRRDLPIEFIQGTSETESPLTAPEPDTEDDSSAPKIQTLLNTSSPRSGAP